MLTTRPALDSDRVILWKVSAVQVMDAPTAIDETGQVTGMLNVISLAVTKLSIVVPIFETVKRYQRSSPSVIVPDESLSS